MHAFCFMNMLFTHAFCICFHSIMLFITPFFILRMKYEQEVGCGEIRNAMPFAVGAMERMRDREGVE